MGAAINDATTLKHHDLIGFLHRGQTVGNHQNRPSTHGPSQPKLDSRFGFGIQSTGGFIQQEHSWIAQHRSSDRDALELTA